MANIYDTGASGVGNAYNQGKDAINSFDPNSFAKSITQGQNALYGVGGAQNQQSDAYTTAYSNAIKSNPTATDLYSTANDKFNVPGLQSYANTLGNAVLTAPQTTLDSAKGFNYDNNQVQNQTNLTLGRLSPLAIAAQNNANTAQGNAANYVQAGLSQNATNLLPIQTQGQQLAQLWAQQATGFDQNAKNQLDALTAKMQAGEKLSEAEMSAYTSLASSEATYEATVKSAQLNNQFKPASPSNGYFDTSTGKYTAPYNSTGAAPKIGA